MMHYWHDMMGESWLLYYSEAAMDNGGSSLMILVRHSPTEFDFYNRITGARHIRQCDSIETAKKMAEHDVFRTIHDYLRTNHP